MVSERCLQLHTELDEIFATTCELEALPDAITAVAQRYIPCQFVSMWLYEPSEGVLVNVVARQSIDGAVASDVDRGRIRLPIQRGPGLGILENLAADIVDGVEVTPEQLIVNDRDGDPRAWRASASGELVAAGLRSEVCAPMHFHGFKGFLCALNHPTDEFTDAHLELLRRAATQAAIAVWSLRERKRADAANRLASLGRAFDYVRHEMMTPLTVMKGATHVLHQLLRKANRSAADDSLIQEMVQMIDVEIERNMLMLDQIRTYAQPTLMLALESADLNRFLEQCQPTTARLMVEAARGRRRSVGAWQGEPRLRLALEPGLASLPLSELHLLLVLRNLVRNACDAGAGEVVVSTAEAADGGAVVLAVTDDGGGVADADLDALFRPYESTRMRAGGSGLGLFLCRRVVEEGHGGCVRATNIVEGDTRRGLRVELTLPRG